MAILGGKMRGDKVNGRAARIAPVVREGKLRFVIREDDRTVGAGVASKIIA